MENDKLCEASQKGLISEETYRKILKYKERLQENGIPVIYNLRHIFTPTFILKFVLF